MKVLRLQPAASSINRLPDSRDREPWKVADWAPEKARQTIVLYIFIIPKYTFYVLNRLSEMLASMSTASNLPRSTLANEIPPPNPLVR